MGCKSVLSLQASYSCENFCALIKATRQSMRAAPAMLNGSCDRPDSFKSNTKRRWLRPSS
eukprot:1224080-Alexandrium_andersonii.AAC.1